MFAATSMAPGHRRSTARRRRSTRRILSASGDILEPLGWKSHWPFVLVLIVTMCAAASGLVTILSMLTTLYREYPGREQTVPWLVTSYMLMSAVAGAICGRLGDLFGARTVILGILVLAGISSVVSAFASSLGLLIASVALQGVATSLSPLLVSLIREHKPRRFVPLLIGVTVATGTTASGILLFLAGFVVDHYSTHAAFLFKAALACASATLLLTIVPPSLQAQRTHEPIDLIRGALFGPAVAGLLITIELGSDWGWTSQRSLTLLGGSIALLIYWSLQQCRAAHPLIQLRLLMHGDLLKANLVMLFMGLAGSQIAQVFVLIFQAPDLGSGTGFDVTATRSGLIWIPMAAVALIASPRSGKIALQYGARSAALIGSLFLLFAWTLLAVFHGSFWLLLASVLTSLTGFSLLMPAAYNLIIEAAPEQSVSGATGLGFTLFQLGSAIGAQLVFMWLRADTVIAPDGVQFPSARSITLATGFVAVITVPLIVIILSITKPARYARQ